MIKAQTYGQVTCTRCCRLHNCVHAGVWHDRAGVQKGPGVPYSQIRIVARARWQLFHLRGILSKGGLRDHVVLAGDNTNIDEEAEKGQVSDGDNAESSCDKVCGR